MKKTSARRLEILLALVMMARGTSFVFSKLLLETMSTFNVLALRCGTDFLVLVALFARRLDHGKYRSSSAHRTHQYCDGATRNCHFGEGTS